MRFKKNDIVYGQDFRSHKGIPHNVEFQASDAGDDFFTIRAPGYGGKPYRNGAIIVYYKDIVEVMNALDQGILQPIEPSKKITLRRFTYKNVYIRQSEWLDKTWDEFRDVMPSNLKLLKTETKEIEIEEQ